MRAGHLPVPTGREEAAGALIEALDALADGRGGVAVIDGEGGIGKSTVASWLAAEARVRDVIVLDAPCFRLSAGTPYAPLAVALRPVLTGAQARGAPALVAGLPSLHLLFEGIDPVGPTSVVAIDEPGLARVRLQHALVTVFSRLALERPVLLVVDDLHWADPASIEVLQSLTADLPDVAVLVVATLRSFEVDERPECRALVRRWRTSVGARVVQLARLDHASVRSLLEHRLGGEVPGRLVEVVHARSAGTPLVAEQLVEAFLQAAVLRRVGPRWDFDDETALAVSHVADDLIGDRLDRLGPDEAALLATVALAGEAVSVDLLAAVTDRLPNELFLELDTLRAAGLLDRVDTPAATGWVPHHPIIGEVAIRRLGPRGVADVHDAYAESLPSAEHVRRSGHLAALPLGRLDDARLRVLTEGGRSALERGAPAEATRLLGTALAAIDRREEADLLPEVLRLLGVAWGRRGETRVAADHLHRALAIERRRGDLAAEAATLLELHRAAWMLDGSEIDFVAETERLIDAFRARGDDAAAHDVVRHRITYLMRRGEHDGLDVDLDRLEALAVRLDDPERRRWTEVLRAAVDLLHLDLVSLDARVCRACDGGGDAELAQRCAILRLERALLVGGRDAVVAATGELQRCCAERGDWPSWRIGIAQWDVAIGDGDLAEAAALEVVVDRSGRHDRPAAYLHLCRVITGLLLGNPVIPTPTMQATTRPHPDGVVEHLLVLADLWSGVPGLGQDVRRLAVARPSIGGLTWLVPVSLGIVALEEGDAASLRAVCDDLEGLDDGAGRASAWARLLRGRAAGGDERLAALLDAAARFRGLGRPLDAAVCVLDALECGADVDGAWLSEVATSVARSGSPWLADRLDAVVAVRGLPLDRKDGVDEELGLTRREREVAELVARGLSNREVAEQLFISVRTVTSHLDHIYTKLGIGSRRDLARVVGPAAT